LAGDVGRRGRPGHRQLTHPLEQLGPDVDEGAGQLTGLPGVPVEVGDGLRPAHRIASRPVVRPGGRWPTRRMASRMPGTNASREVVSWRSESVWPRAPRITSWWATRPGRRMLWMGMSPPRRAAVAR